MVKLKALNEKLPVFGKAEIEMSNAARQVHTTIIVIRGKIDFHLLIRH